ncbi:hypothetical protein L873DRAFT_1792685 [Choiromyces venosus 120613-1]|uniref:Ubiquitin 3 binding protein But2 C-terminal domain-containing protein n=1 Tax=Choiromyces venosus 120613-1 TaxID=1336337 RepID=A0A3N4J900_9PEZI|nr:hypothetical protein L873DRAFT_1792685 [Choiromyces venosus 120613-1]
MHFSISLLMFFPLAAWCAPSAEGPTAPAPAPPPALSSPAPGGIVGAFTPPGKQEVVQTYYTNHDNKNISATVEFKCAVTPASAQLKDVGMISTDYITKAASTFVIPKGAPNTCVPLDEKKGLSAAKLEACGNDAKVMYPEVGKALQKFMTWCIKPFDNVPYVGGTMEFMADGKAAFTIKVNKA